MDYYGNSGPAVVDYRPPGLSEKQDMVIQLVAQYVAYSQDPSRYQFLVRDRTKHNHNFLFLVEGDKAYDYYRYLLHTHLQRAQMGYKNERYQRDQFSDEYANQLQQQQVDQMRHYQQAFVAPPAPQSTASVTTVEPPRKLARVEPERKRPDSDDDDDDDDEGPRIRIVVENGVHRVITE